MYSAPITKRNPGEECYISIVPQKKPPCFHLPRNKGEGGRIPLVKHSWRLRRPQKKPPLFPSARNKGVSSEGGGFFCGIVLIIR